MTLSQFIAHVYPDLYVSKRVDRGPLWKLLKWMGLRVAYLVYKMGISANLLNILAIILIPLQFYFIYLYVKGNFWLPLIGIGLIFFDVFLDAVDGAVARGRNEVSKIGAVLDDIGPEINRVLMLMLLSLYTEDQALILLIIFSSYILVFFVKRTLPCFSQATLFQKRILALYWHPLGPNSVRWMLGVLPLALGISILVDLNVKLFSIIVSYLYIFLAVSWIFLCAIIPTEKPGTLRL